ncbi:hypothetical protein P691DRAFT_704507 [Macrolepiota fuliginosa MF-IS2]|uniref:F-box domain-containing protein n=1 Tax=Macrolepiota fuliginosa MF-IS2 TaxID=1400762 RepID=A0A9P5XC69_9AGAR|nr:hypothetical protein P691DRAFT_704507 [Macrolepiota fuliginosa MF-IS2]
MAVSGTAQSLENPEVDAFEAGMVQQGALELPKGRKTTQIMNKPSSTMTAKSTNVTLLDLPPEILTHVLLDLPFTSVVACQGVNRHLQVLISGSAELQYYTHLGMYGQVNNPRSNLSISERLRRLITRQRRWEELDFDFDKIIEVPSGLDSSATLSTGVFYAADTDGTFRFVRIPNSLDREVKWRKVHTEKEIISTGTCVCEYDLHVLITAQPRTIYMSVAEPRTVHEVQIHLKRLSTGGPHPDVQRATISFETHAEFGTPYIFVECAGDNLLLVLLDYSVTLKPEDEVYVYEWKTGEPKLALCAPFSSYGYPFFLTTDIFLLPNVKNGELEYWKIPQSPSESIPLRPLLVLSLPQLRSGNILTTFNGRAEPAPSTRSCDATKHFYTDPRHAIAIFCLDIQSAEFVPLRHFRLFVHRSSLVGCLDQIPTFTSLNGRPEPIPYDKWGPSVCRWFNADRGSWFEITFGQRYITEAGTEDEPLTLIDFNPIDVARVLAAEKHRLKAGASHEDGRRVDRNEGDGCLEEWSLVDNGSEYKGENEQVPLRTHETSAPGILFGTPTEKRETYDPPREQRSQAKAVIRALSPLNDPHYCFENTVYSSLPYTVRSSQDMHGFDEILLDEESILGVQYSDLGFVKQIHVLHYG